MLLIVLPVLIGSRFKVLQMFKKNDKILGFLEKLPTFNGKNIACIQT